MTLLQASPEHLIHWLLDEGSQSLEVFGRENGFNERADVVKAADGTDLNEFWNEVMDTIRIRNAKKNTMINVLTYPVVDITSEVSVPSSVDFEKASEYGQPVGIKGGATRFFRGYDFDFYDLAIRYTWMYLAEASADDLRVNHNLALEADTKLQFRKVMERLFNPINTSGYTDKNEPMTVYAAYNGDGEVPPDYNNTTFAGTHTHYVVSGNAAVTSVNVDNLATLLTEHGYDLQNGYQLILWVNKQEATIIKTYKTSTGASFDFVPNPNLYGGKVWVPNNGSYVGGPEGTVPGEIGTYGPFHVVEEGLIPAGYLVAIATGGTDRLTNPIGLRQHSNPNYRGLKLIPGARSDYPLIDSFYRRGIGTGVRQRGSIAIMQVKAALPYVIPAAYDPATF
jgi:hypothetical protein